MTVTTLWALIPRSPVINHFMTACREAHFHCLVELTIYWLVGRYFALFRYWLCSDFGSEGLRVDDPSTRRKSLQRLECIYFSPDIMASFLLLFFLGSFLLFFLPLPSFLLLFISPPLFIFGFGSFPDYTFCYHWVCLPLISGSSNSWSCDSLHARFAMSAIFGFFTAVYSSMRIYCLGTC